MTVTGTRGGVQYPLQGQTPDSYANLGNGHVVVYGPEGRALYDVSSSRIKVVEWNQAPNISKHSLSLFVSDIGSGEFFSYVGHLVSLEQAISVLGLLSPDFIDVNGHIFWLPNAPPTRAPCLPLLQMS
ncbi:MULTISPECIES: hypothetical protein [Pseudomonas syringae group]|uniref:hypothetical protein n=1 Tax=Pseudomonas syringae group TaxID=136849 RepID=UPI0018D89A2C|nr:hypothetical protein [Pseudomonas viridiflava]MEE4078925.1 hypothetical protein [Pseudomonas viridiflava]MEE4084156.1 hypothetical protein [Pseudomonas viridiflava]MEE4160841.1 hypothetical protein [Pseudomonas viridiflava]